MIRLLLVDEQEIVRRGIREKLETTTDVHVVREARSVRTALAVDGLHDVDVALLDVGLHDGTGVYLCRELRSKRPDLACLLLTSYADDNALDEAVLAGAHGFVMKDISGNEFIEALNRVARGESLLSDDMIEQSKTRLARRSEEEERLARLSPQELRILHLLSKGRTNREISEEMFLAESTVKNYLAHLLRKLGYARRAEAALFAQRHESSSDVVNASEN
jgi:DNA-binding NarL/FixJ family response regulator